MVAYQALASDEMKEGDMPTDMIHKMIKKMQNIVSSHCAVLNFDAGHLNRIFKEATLDVVVYSLLDNIYL